MLAKGALVTAILCGDSLNTSKEGRTEPAPAPAPAPACTHVRCLRRQARSATLFVKLWKWNGKRLGNVCENLSNHAVVPKFSGNVSLHRSSLFFMYMFFSCSFGPSRICVLASVCTGRRCERMAAKGQEHNDFGHLPVSRIKIDVGQILHAIANEVSE